MNPKYCSKCGTLHYEEGNYCGNCKKMGYGDSDNIGEPLNQFQNSVDNNITQYHNNNYNNNFQNNPEKKGLIDKLLAHKWIFVGVAIVIIAIIAVPSILNNKGAIKSTFHSNDYSWRNPFVFENNIYNDQGNKLLNIEPEEVIEYGQLFLVKEKNNNLYSVYKKNGEIMQGLKVNKPSEKYNADRKGYVLTTDSKTYFYDEDMHKMYESDSQNEYDSILPFGNEKEGYLYEISTKGARIYWKNGKIITVRIESGDTVEENYIKRGDNSIDYVDKDGNINNVLSKSEFSALEINPSKSRGFYLSMPITIPYDYFIYHDMDNNVTVFNKKKILFTGTMQQERYYYLIEVNKNSMLIVQKDSDLIEYYKDFKLVKTFDNKEYSIGRVYDYGFYIESRDSELRDYYDLDGNLLVSSVKEYIEEETDNFKIIKKGDEFTVYNKNTNQKIYNCQAKPKHDKILLLKESNYALLECEDKSLMLSSEKIEKEFEKNESIFNDYMSYKANITSIDYRFPTSVIITKKYVKKQALYTLYNIKTNKMIEETGKPKVLGPNEEVILFEEKDGHSRIYNNQLDLILEK